MIGRSVERQWLVSYLVRLVVVGPVAPAAGATVPGDAGFDDAVALGFADTSSRSPAEVAALDFDGDGDVDFEDAVQLAFAA